MKTPENRQCFRASPHGSHEWAPAPNSHGGLQRGKFWCPGIKEPSLAEMIADGTIVAQPPPIPEQLQGAVDKANVEAGRLALRRLMKLSQFIEENKSPYLSPEYGYLVRVEDIKRILESDE